MPPKTETAEKARNIKYKPTIGLIGLNKLKIATLNRLIVEEGNKSGFSDDQEHPAVFAVGLNHDETNIVKTLQDHANLCHDFGCDIIAIASSSSGESQTNRYIVRELNLEVMHKNLEEAEDDLRPLAKRIIDRVLRYDKKIKRPNINNYPQKELDRETLKALEKDKADRSKRLSQHPKAIEFDHRIYGVLGGAGPAASAKFCEHLASHGNEFVHWSENSAPGKHRFENENGTSYIPFYRNIIDFFGEINLQNIAIPCNTAHKRLKEFCPESMIGRIKDFREAVVQELKRAKYKKAILLGTNATVGVNNKDELGIYAQYCREHDEEFTFITPSEDQQILITQAIYFVKAGQDAKAKELIEKVINELRAQHGKGLPAILACTELPLAFLSSELERAEKGFLDPARLLLSRTRVASMSSAKSGDPSFSSDDSSDETTTPPYLHIDPDSFSYEAIQTGDDQLEIIISLKPGSPPKSDPRGKELRNNLSRFSQETFASFTHGRTGHRDDKEKRCGDDGDKRSQRKITLNGEISTDSIRRFLQSKGIQSLHTIQRENTLVSDTPGTAPLEASGERQSQRNVTNTETEV